MNDQNLEQRRSFENYVWSFYGPGEIHGQIFKNLRRAELKAALALFYSVEKNPEFDSFDRIIVRDIILTMRGRKKTEYQVSAFFA